MPELPPTGGKPRSREELDGLRDASEVYYNTAADRWVFTRYEDVFAILRDERLSVDPRHAGEKTGSRHLGVLAEMGNLNFVDAPVHTRLRKVVAQVFTPKFAETLREPVRALLDEILSTIPAGPFDFVASVSRPLSLRVIACLLIGLDKGDLPAFTSHLPDLSQTFNSDFPKERALAARQKIKELWAKVVLSRRDGGGSDYVSLLLEGRDEARLSENEVLELLTVTFVAGNMSTAQLMNNTIHLLLTHPEQREKLDAEPSLVKNAVEEALRLESPIGIVTRFAPSETEVRGCTVEAGAEVAVLSSVAARDPEVNPEPLAFDISRKNIKHQAFGGGPHVCIGAPLARLEAELVVTGVLARFPDLRLDPTRPPVRMAAAANGLQSLWLIP